MRMVLDGTAEYFEPWACFTTIAWIRNYIHQKVRDEIIYPFPNFNGAANEGLEWITNFIPHFFVCDYLSLAGIKDLSMIYLALWD